MRVKLYILVYLFSCAMSVHYKVLIITDYLFLSLVIILMGERLNIKQTSKLPKNTFLRLSDLIQSLLSLQTIDTKKYKSQL